MLFNQLGLSDEALQAVEEIGYTEATEIQAKTIPLLLEGKDIIGRSQTGTGKTAAFGLPAVDIMEKGNRTVQVLILCPTRELAMQACNELSKFAKYLPHVNPCAIYGGADIERQITQLKKGANLVVGTPGRVMDHIKRKTLKLENLRTIILDEADEMLNMGFREDIEEILKFIPSEHQTVLFSATMPPQIMAITKEYQNEPIVVGVEQKSRTVESVTQYFYEVPMGRKSDALQMLMLAHEPRLSMIFCNTKHMVDELTEALIAKGMKAAGLHGDMKQQTRTQVLNSFKAGRMNILIATDVAARGIDVDNVDAVFNYDIPQDNEYYIHRIGRTGRAGKTGVAYNLVSGRRQVSELNNIARFTKADIIRMELPTRDEILSKKTEHILERITKNITDDKYASAKIHLEKLIESGFSAEQIAISLLGMKISHDTRAIPEFIRAIPKQNNRDRDRQNGGKSMGRDTGNRPSRNGTATKLEISVGRFHRIAPNYILGALTDATGLTGRSFGKIDIYDKFTTVEIPEADKDHILETMTGTKINGQKISVKFYEGKGKAFDDSPKDYRNLGRKSYGGRDRKKSDDSGSKSQNKRRRYQ